MPFLLTSCNKAATKPTTSEVISPNDLLFSLPTLCDPAPAIEESPAPAGARPLHEDDWRQIEFVPVVDESYIRSELATLAAFKLEHQKASGWTSVYLRKEHPRPLQTLELQNSSLPPFRKSALTLGGRVVRGGFALSDGGDWFVYGQQSAEGRIIQLAVSPGRTPLPERFAEAMAKIAKTAGLLLVDWYDGAIVNTRSPKSVLTWTRRYEAQ